MKRLAFILLITLGLNLMGIRPVLADFPGIDNQNNKIGIHLAVASEEDLQDAASLVNTSGGDWGYVTIVIEETDRNTEKWQKVFDQMRQLHLIPIVRLATSPQGDIWRRPVKEEANVWADFLDSLNWIVKNRYVVLFNEPNFNKEWGGKIDPEDYGQMAFALAQALKEKSSDFFVMLAGFNGNAPQALPHFEEEEIFLKEMVAALGGVEKAFANIDGWASHSYETDTYIREMEMLKRLGLNKELPVFITEAGWPHAEGLNYRRELYSQQSVQQNLLSYFGQILADPRVVAITPFILNYQSEPFDHFSWRKQTSSKGFYSQFQATQQLAKVKGNPSQEQKLEPGGSLPKKLIINSTYQIPIRIKNMGQAIWDKADGYSLKFINDQDNFEYLFSDFNKLTPFNEETIWLYLKTKGSLGRFDFSLVVDKEGETVSSPIFWVLETVPPVKIDLKASFFPRRLAEGDNFKLLIYNSKEELIFERSELKMKKGQGEVASVYNLEIGSKYRVVLLKPYYLPRQEFLIVGELENKVIFEPLLPLDFNLDGRSSWDDVIIIFKNPRLVSRILW